MVDWRDVRDGDELTFKGVAYTNGANNGWVSVRFGDEYRNMNLAHAIAHEPRRFAAGDRVRVHRGREDVKRFGEAGTGTVLAADGDTAWVRWDCGGYQNLYLFKQLVRVETE